MQMELGEVSHEKEVLESKKQTVHPHATSNINIPEEHISKMHSEKAVLLHNCLFTRMYVGRNGVLDEIGNGYSIGPGHGLIVSQIGNNIRVDEAADRVWYKKFNPWMPRHLKTSR